MSFTYSQWPPALSPKQVEELSKLAATYALSHGILYLPAQASQPQAPSSAIHAPISLVPSPIPRSLFELALRSQSLYNELYARIAMDDRFLDEVMGADVGVGQVDDFVAQLWKGWKQIRDEGPIAQPLHLGLFRSDYLLHDPPGRPLSLKQVEFNTISVSFGALGEKVAGLHRYLLSSTDYYGSSPHLTAANFPKNETIAGLGEGLAEAHKAYGVPSAKVLVVIQENERNVFDQRWLEYELLEKHSIHTIRQTFSELATSAVLDQTSKTLSVTASRTAKQPTEISIVYFRTGYTPGDYSSLKDFEIRVLLERSRAIKCPTIPLQLAGGKKIQQVLSEPGVLERSLKRDPDELALLRNSWMDMWALDVGSTSDGGEPEGVKAARAQHERLVLKPQREGGGNNVYRSAIPAFLDDLPVEERRAWIAMRLIEPPSGVSSLLVRAGGSAEQAARSEVVSELGIFGWALFGNDKVGEKEVGWIVRTKGRDSDEGGVAAGFSVLDSLVLIDG